MIFGMDGEYQERYTSREEAIAGHARALEHARAVLPSAPERR
jgi:hypothetical protein